MLNVNNKNTTSISNNNNSNRRKRRRRSRHTTTGNSSNNKNHHPVKTVSCIAVALLAAVAAVTRTEAYIIVPTSTRTSWRIPQLLERNRRHDQPQKPRGLYASVSASDSSRLSSTPNNDDETENNNKNNNNNNMDKTNNQLHKNLEQHHIHEYCTEIDFELHVGRALDVLRHDYADGNLLVSDPDYSLYDGQRMEFTDPSGVKVHGLRNYQKAFALLHTLVKVLYCPTSSGFTRVSLCYDPTKRSIRIHWNAVLQPRQLFFGVGRQLQHVDGISVYELDRASGNVTRHVLEHLIINNQAISPEEGVVEALTRYHGRSVPSYYYHYDHDAEAPQQQQPYDPSRQQQQSQQQDPQDLFTVPFLQWNTRGGAAAATRYGGSLFAPALVKGPNKSSSNREDDGMHGVATTTPSQLQSMEASQSGGNGGGEGGALEIDWDALERKNVSRQKFGMKPLTPEEFVQLQSTVQEMDAAQQAKRQEQLRQKQLQEREEAKLQEEQQQQRSNNVLNKLFGNVLKDTCQDNFDCERPQVCCDFGFKKMCCASGSPVLGSQLALVPVPVETADDPGNKPPPRY